MTDSSSPHFIEPVRPVDPLTCRVLRLVDVAALATGSCCFVAGAAARDLVLVNAFGFPPGRATRDIDFGIAVAGWAQFKALKQQLIGSNEFAAGPADTHRLFWNGAGAVAEIPIDIIPFGGIASADQTIAWPPRCDVVMNVAGFEEAFQSSIRLEIEDGLVVRVASIPGLAIMKLIAWQDRRHQTNKDAADLHRLVLAYAEAGNSDRIYEEELPLLESAEYDLELAGAQLLGRDAARICRQDTHGKITDLISSERLTAQLILQMQTSGLDEAQQMQRISDLVNRFAAGFLTQQAGCGL